MIVLRKPSDDPFDWYWVCEFCGASDDHDSPGGPIDHSQSCPDPTWAKRIKRPLLIAPEWVCRLLLWAHVRFKWRLPEFYFVALLERGSGRRRKDGLRNSSGV